MRTTHLFSATFLMLTLTFIPGCGGSSDSKDADEEASQGIIAATVGYRPGPANELAPILSYLTIGLQELMAPKHSGGLVVHGAHATPVFAIEDFSSPLVAIGFAGSGRIVVAADEQWLFDSRIVNHKDSRTLVERLLTWVGRGGKKLLLVGSAGAADDLRALGYDVTSVSNMEAAPASLQDFAVIALGTYKMEDHYLAPLQAYAENGGGLFVATTGWLLSDYGLDGAPVAESPIDKLSTAFGISHTKGVLSEGSGEAHSLDLTLARSRHLSVAQARLLTIAKGEARDASDAPHLIDMIREIVQTTTPENSYLSDDIRETAMAWYESAKNDLIPTVTAPIASDDWRRRAGIALVTFVKASADPASVGVNADAAEFPGAVAAEAERVTETVAVNVAIPRWHSTGLYAAPGDVITVSVDEAALANGLRLRIGSHDDLIWKNFDKDVWRRWPDITYERPINTVSMRIASPHGGHVYVVVPEKEDAAGQVNVTIAGAVRAARYVLGETTAEQWQTTQRRYAAPWVEIENEGMIFTLPFDVAAKIDDPGPGSDWWRRAVEFQTDLAQREPWTYPERYVQDVQITNGYLHAGYPTTGTHWKPGEMLDLEHLSDGTEWGELHELGHNRQRPDWTFDGTTEVTVNLFTLYAATNLTGIDVWNYPGLSGARAAGVAYMQNPSFDKWKSDSGAALIMYVQIIRDFGWQPIKDVFKEYEELAATERPANDDAMRDQWMVRLSKRIGRNLGPYFDSWKVPVSASAKAEIEALPEWTPPSM